MWLWLLLTVGIYWFVALVIFAVNTVRGLVAKLPRRLTGKQKRRIIAYLEKYRDDKRIVQVKICYDPDTEKEKEASPLEPPNHKGPPNLYRIYLT
jgi:hypothetical protein